MFIIIIYTLLHDHRATSRIHTSDNALKLSAPNPPDTISSGCVCPVRGPAIQQAAWSLLAHGIFPLVFSLDQCWEMYSKMRFVYAYIQERMSRRRDKLSVASSWVCALDIAITTTLPQRVFPIVQDSPYTESAKCA